MHILAISAYCLFLTCSGKLTIRNTVVARLFGLSSCIFMGYWNPLRYVFSKSGLVGAWSTFLSSLPWPQIPAQAWRQYKFEFRMIFNYTLFHTCRSDSRLPVDQPSWLDTEGMDEESWFTSLLHPRDRLVVTSLSWFLRIQVGILGGGGGLTTVPAYWARHSYCISSVPTVEYWKR